jgi:hypothetical protein
MSSLVSVVICSLAVYRLRQTPLYVATLALLAVSLLAAAVTLLLERRAARSRLSTGLTHVSTALGAFFLFVSFALP